MVRRPRHLGNIYASEAALAEVSCQRCRRMFRVALTEVFASNSFSLSDEIRLARVISHPPHCDFGSLHVGYDWMLPWNSPPAGPSVPGTSAPEIIGQRQISRRPAMLLFTTRPDCKSTITLRF